MTEPLPVTLGDYQRPDVTAIVKPVGLADIRRRLLDEVGAGARRTALWEYGDEGVEPAAAAALDSVRATRLDPDLEAAVVSTLEDDLATEKVMRQQDDLEFDEWSRERFGVPSAEDLAAAMDVLAEPTAPEPIRDISATEIAERFTRVLRHLRLDGWSVHLIDEMASRASVESAEKAVRVRSGAVFAVNDAERLVAHEIGGHVLRSINAENQPPELLARLPLGNSSETEEGLAIQVEADLGALRQSDLRTYAARLVAARIATTSGVLDVARELMPHVGTESAVDIAIRVKRGLRDPNGPGGMYKDIGYFHGAQMIGSALEADPSLLRILFATKWSFAHSSLTRKLAQRGLIDLERVVLPAKDLITA